MIRFGFQVGLMTAVATVGALALVGCAGDDGGSLGTSSNALTRVVAEAAGSNCPAGGQAFQYGIDANGNDQLDEEEVKGTSYVCNGAVVAPKFESIPVGDPRCPNGGTRIVIEGGASPQESIVCNGVQGAQGDKGDQGVQGIQGEQGIQGDAGAQGAQGDAGAAAPEPVLGQFLASQIVKGAVVTCTTFTVAGSTSECRGMKLNGVDARLAPTEANVICNAITGKGYNTASGMGVVSQYIGWTNGAWTLANASTSPMQNLTCNK